LQSKINSSDLRGYAFSGVCSLLEDILIRQSRDGWVKVGEFDTGGLLVGPDLCSRAASRRVKAMLLAVLGDKVLADGPGLEEANFSVI